MMPTLPSLPLATNPVEQLIGWSVELGNQVFANWETVSAAIAVALSIYLVFVMYERLNSSDDPSLRLATSSGGGSMSILLSGTHVTGLLLAAIALLIWPAPIEQPFIGAVMLGVFGTHYYLEKREVSMN